MSALAIGMSIAFIKAIIVLFLAIVFFICVCNSRSNACRLGAIASVTSMVLMVLV